MYVPEYLFWSKTMTSPWTNYDTSDLGETKRLKVGMTKNNTKTLFGQGEVHIYVRQLYTLCCCIPQFCVASTAVLKPSSKVSVLTSSTFFTSGKRKNNQRREIMNACARQILCGQKHTQSSLFMKNYFCFCTQLVQSGNIWFPRQSSPMATSTRTHCYLGNWDHMTLFFVGDFHQWWKCIATSNGQ